MKTPELPRGWAETTIGEILRGVIGGGTPSRKNKSYFAGSIPWFTVKDMKALRPMDSLEHISDEAISKSATNLLPANTLIVATRIAVGRPIKPTVACTINQDLKALILPVGIDSDFLLYWFLANEQLILDRSSGTTVAGIRLETLRTLPIRVPPSAAQTRIVEKLEWLLSDLDAGVTELKAAQKKLALYRQSLLKAAVEGDLTSEWREKQRNACAERGERMEAGAQLLERILAERRRRWEEKQLAKFNAQGKTPPKDWQRKYSEPIAPDTESLTELPEGWAWATIDQLALEQRYGSSAKTSANQSGVPVLRMGNIQDGTLDLGNLKYLPLEHNEFPNLILQDGDLLFNRTNSPELVGKSAVYRSQIAPCSYASYLIAVRFSPMFVPELAAMYINSGFGKRWIKSVVSQQVGQANVNGTKLAALAIPLPPHQEQIEILRMTNELLAGAHVQDAEIEFGLKQTSAQRKNILKAAFSGQLVSQDPNDEPASVLLERIRAERAPRESNGKRARTLADAEKPNTQKRRVTRKKETEVIQ